MNLRRFAIVSVLGAATHSASGQADGDPRAPWPPRGYACVRTAKPPQIDGRIDAEEWALSAWSEPFIDILGDRRPAPRHGTRMRLMWDGEFLYIAASLEEPHLWATLAARDSVIYYDNDFEVFIDPSADTHLYSEIEINALNTVWDLLLVRTYDDGGPAIHAWDIPGLRTAVQIDGTLNEPSDADAGWSVEMAIPWAALAETAGVACPPKPGDRWRMNFSRVQWRLDVRDGKYVKRVDEAGAPLAEDNWVWSEQRAIAMHEPEYWGIVEFRDTLGGPTVEPTPVDRAMWCLRQVFRVVRAHAQTHGGPPERLASADGVAATLSVYQPPDGWEWPPVYTRDGDRWTVRTRNPSTGGSVTVFENGRTLRAGPD